MDNLSSEHAHAKKREILAQLLQNGSLRYKAAMQSRWARANWSRSPHTMPDEDKKRLHEWFEAWHLALQEAYRCAVNEDDSLIGKQQALDNVRAAYPLLPPRLPSR